MEAALAPAPEPGTQDDLTIDTGGQLSWKAGGKQPDTSTLRLTGGKVDVEGQFEKGETVRVVITATVGEVGFVDVVDHKTQQTVGCERRHKARIVGVELDR